MIKGSYLFDDDPHRIIQDPESLRASSIRQASAWQDWGALRDAVVLQMNSSDHNPAVRTDLSPQDSWELATPQMMKFYVKGGPHSNGKHGYIVSNAELGPVSRWRTRSESFVIALANMDVAVSLRIDRFSSPFFTAADPAKVLHLPPGGEFALYLAGGGGYTPVDLQQEMQSLTNPVAPSGAAIVGTVEDLQAQTRIKAYRARQAVSTTFDLLGHDLLNAAFWLDVRKAQDPSRNFGAGPTAAWTAFRKVVPIASGSGQSAGSIAADGGHGVPQGHSRGHVLCRRRQYAPARRRVHRVGLVPSPHRTHRFCAAWALFGAMAPVSRRAGAGSLQRRSCRRRAGESIVLTGHDLSIDQVIAIARYGAKVDA